MHVVCIIDDIWYMHILIQHDEPLYLLDVTVRVSGLTTTKKLCCCDSWVDLANSPVLFRKAVESF